MADHRLRMNNVLNEKKIIIRPADWCVFIALMCNFLILLGEPLRRDGIVSLGSRGLIFSALGFGLLQFINMIKQERVRNSYYFLALLITTLFSVLLLPL